MIKEKKLSLLIMFMLMLSIGCNSLRNGKEEVFNNSAATDEMISEIIQHKEVPGISLAVFNDKSVLFHRSAGVKDAGSGEPVGAQTVFEAASLSKTLFAYIALQHIEKGILSLHSPLPSLWVSKSLEGDLQHLKLTASNLLSHTSGLPNWRGMPNLAAKSRNTLFNPEDSLKIMFEPGSQFSYSGEGYLYLQTVLEEVTAKSLNTLAEEYVFSPLKMEHSSFVFDTTISGNFATGHNENNEATAKYRPQIPLAAASLHTNAGDYASFLVELVKKTRTSPVFRKMIEEQVEVIEENNKLYKVFWGLGVGIMSLNGKSYLFHWGDNGVFKSYYIYSIADNLGFVYFANGVKGLSIRNKLSRSIFGEDIPMWPEDYVQ